jgi:hypothetical protein
MKDEPPKIFVSYPYTKYQKFHFEKSSGCCGGGIYSSAELTDAVEEYEFLYGVFPEYAYHLKSPRITYRILWADGLATICNRVIPTVESSIKNKAEKNFANFIQKNNP